MSQTPFQQLLSRWQAGELDLNRLEHEIRTTFAATTLAADVQIDMDRQRRCGIGTRWRGHCTHRTGRHLLRSFWGRTSRTGRLRADPGSDRLRLVRASQFP